MSQMLLNPVVSEKALSLAEGGDTYVFIVPRSANKITVGKAVAAHFKVRVQSVRMLNQSGKNARSVVKGGRKRIEGKRPAFKKAYVKLVSGESIKLFEEAK